MKESIIVTMLSVTSGILLLVAVVGIKSKDRVAPVINIESETEMVFHEGDSDEVLLENVTAMDEKDGDVTESLRVSEIYVTDEEEAVVVYVAKDKANNIGKLKKKITYQKASQEIDLPEESQMTDNTEEEKNSLSEPKVIMIQQEATLQVGDEFNILRYIQGAVDGEGNDISTNMHLEGTYDTTKPGIYPLEIYVIDSNGVRSVSEEFLLTVRE